MLFLLLYFLSLSARIISSQDCEFSCKGYDCLPRSWICDTFSQCEDDWDEGKEAG